jgi:hypothetical protein
MSSFSPNIDRFSCDQYENSDSNVLMIDLDLALKK